MLIKYVFTCKLVWLLSFPLHCVEVSVSHLLPSISPPNLGFLGTPVLFPAVSTCLCLKLSCLQNPSCPGTRKAGTAGLSVAPRSFALCVINECWQVNSPTPSKDNSEVHVLHCFPELPKVLISSCPHYNLLDNVSFIVFFLLLSVFPGSPSK